MSKPKHTLGISKLRRAQLVGGPYIELIAQHEAMVKCLYQTFAIAYPSLAKFWNHLADEEEQHFRLVKALEADIKNNDVAFKRPSFSQAQVSDAIAWICARKERVQHGGVSINDALSMCVQIEQGMIEHRFFDVMDEDSEDVRNVLTQLEKSSIIHLQRARKEAGRLKWKMWGTKINEPFSKDACLASPLDTKEDPRAAVKAAHGAILSALISMEEAASHLYNTYAELLPDTAQMWSALSADEMAHATMLHKLEDILDQGHMFKNMGKFGVQGLKRCIDDLLNAETKARRSGTTYTDAMITALRTESYMAECEFYTSVESSSPEFQRIAKELVELTGNHIKKLEDGGAPSSTVDEI